MVVIVKQNYYKNKIKYNEIKKRLKEKLEKDIPIDHVGSTAIPNMYGKNIIDILIGASDEKQFGRISEVLKNIGYISSDKNNSIYNFFASTNKETNSGDIHIHLAILDTKRYNEFIILKNYLLTNEYEKLNYSKFKRDIVKRGVSDRREYRKIKSEYVSKLIARAWMCDNVRE